VVPEFVNHEICSVPLQPAETLASLVPRRPRRKQWAGIPAVRILCAWTAVIAVFATIAAAQKSQVAPPKPAARKAIVTFKDGRLSVNAQGSSLGILLQEISRRARIAVAGPGGDEGQTVSLQFQNLPLEEGLRQVLKDCDTFFFYGKEDNSKASAVLKAVWVYPGGQGRGFEPIPPEQWASTKELEGMLADPDPKVRSQAVKGLVERNSSNAADVVLRALADPDNEVAWEALYEAESTGVQLPANTLEDLVLHGGSPEIKVLALEGLKDNPESSAVAEQALTDPDPHVQSKAREILKELAAAERSAQRSQLAPPTASRRPQE
jgi:hypothetical protein